MRVVVARPGTFSPHDKQTYQGVQRDGIEVIVATELASVVVNAEAVTFRVPDEIISLEPDVVDVPDIHYALSQYLAAQLPPHVRLVCTAFDNLPGKNWSGPLRWVDRVDLFVARSRMVRKMLLWDGVPGEKIRVIPPGVDTELFAPMPFVPKQRAVLFVGRLNLEKGLKTLITAMKGLDAEVWAIGGGDDEAVRNYQKWAEAYGVKLKMLGKVGHDEQLAQFYREAMVFCLPSFPVDSWDPFCAWLEQWGVAVLEAMASGLPVITTDVGSFGEMIEQGRQGYMVPAWAWPALHNLLALLLKNAAMRDEMGGSGRELAEGKFGSEVIGDRLALLYRTLMNADER